MAVDSRAQWDEVLDKMVGEGAEGSDEDFVAVARYLVGEYGRVNVNATRLTIWRWCSTWTPRTPTRSSRTGRSTGSSRISPR